MTGPSAATAILRRQKRGSVSKMGQADIRALLIVGAMSRIRWIVRKGALPDNWLGHVLNCKPRMGGCGRLGQQDGAHDLGDDDARGELTDGVSWSSSPEANR